MTIFTTHDCRFTSFRTLLFTKEYMEILIILFERYQCQLNHSLKSSKVEVVGTTLSSLASQTLTWNSARESGQTRTCKLQDY